MIATITVCSLDFDKDYIEHYLDHYNCQGADRHFLIFHSKIPVKEEEVLLKYGRDNVFVSIFYGEWNAKIAMNIKHSLIKLSPFSEEDWLIHSDIDEQAECSTQTLKQKITEMSSLGEHFCWGRLVDKIRSDGSILKIKSGEKLSKQFPESSDLGRRILKCNVRKVVISRTDVFLDIGNHQPLSEYKGFISANKEILTISHYKWAGNVIEKLEERVKTHKGRFGHAKESERFLKFWEDSGKLKKQ